MQNDDASDAAYIDAIAAREARYMRSMAKDVQPYNEEANGGRWWDD